LFTNTSNNFDGNYAHANRCNITLPLVWGLACSKPSKGLQIYRPKLMCTESRGVDIYFIHGDICYSMVNIGMSLGSL